MTGRAIRQTVRSRLVRCSSIRRSNRRAATTIQHRWYQDDRLRQAVELRVEANRTAGYRTYSRNLMKSESAGDWRVEVRSEDGSLLHEERFAVR